MSLEPGRLIYGDGLDWRSQWDDQCVDLIYLGPPFNSNQDYNILYSDKGRRPRPIPGVCRTWSIAESFDHRFPALSLMTHPYAGKPLSTQRSLLDCT